MVQILEKRYLFLYSDTGYQLSILAFSESNLFTSLSFISVSLLCIILAFASTSLSASFPLYCFAFLVGLFHILTCHLRLFCLYLYLHHLVPFVSVFQYLYWALYFL